MKRFSSVYWVDATGSGVIILVIAKEQQIHGSFGQYKLITSNNNEILI